MLKQKIQRCWKSWTIWLNATSIAMFPFIRDITDYFPTAQQYLGPDAYKYVGCVVFALNIVMRFKTSQDLKDK